VIGTILVMGRLTYPSVTVQLKHLAQPGLGAP
jgi:hypothetical protein